MDDVFKCWLVSIKDALTEHLWLSCLFCDAGVNLPPKALSPQRFCIRQQILMMKSRALWGKDITIYHMNNQVHSQGLQIPVENPYKISAFGPSYNLLERLSLSSEITARWAWLSQAEQQLLGDLRPVCSEALEPPVPDPCPPPDGLGVLHPLIKDWGRPAAFTKWNLMRSEKNWVQVWRMLAWFIFFPSSKRPCIFNGCRLTPVMNPKCPMHIKAGFRKH